MPGDDGAPLAPGRRHLADIARLSGRALSIAVPRYDRSQLRGGIVHIGVGGFHRAHLAHYADQLAAAGETGWGIVGAGILADDAAMAEALVAQDHLYTLVVRGERETSGRLIGSVVDYIHAHPDPSALVDRIANPDTQIVSLTITEGGYPVDDVSGRYDPESAVAGDGSAFHLLALGLDRRRIENTGPLTVLSCDNVVGNGHMARAATVGEARRVDAELAVRDQLAADGPVALSALALAGWCLYLRGGPNARSEPIEVAGDPNRQEVMARATRSLTDPASFLGYEPVFGSDLGSNASLVPAFVAALGSLERTGVVPSITDALGVEERKMGRDPRAP